MSTVPVTAATMDSLLLKVAEKLGVAFVRTDGTSCLPDDDFNLGKCIERVNQGIGMFIDNAPVEGWRWTRRLATVALAPAYTGTATAGAATYLTDGGIAGDYADDFFNTFTIKITAGTGEGETAAVTDYDGTLGKFTFAALSGGSTPDTTSEYRICRSADVIDADPARYLLPLDFGGQYTGKIRYAANSGHSTCITLVDESEIRARRATVVNTGYPMFAAIRPYQPTTTVMGTLRRWEIVFDPQPSAADSVEFPYIVTFDGVQMMRGTADSASATNIVDATLTTLYPKDDILNGWVCEIVDGTGRGSYAVATDYTGATGTITVADWLSPSGAAAGTDPGTSSKFILKPIHPYYHPAGFAYDNVIEVACLAACEIFGVDTVHDEHYSTMFYTQKIKEAWRINARMVPKNLGKWTDGPSRIRERTWSDITTDHDV
jgi:hypothetical protein